MRLLPKYLLKETVMPFLMALTLITFLLITNRLLTLVDLVLKHGVSLWSVFKMLAYLLPNTFALTVPMSLLVAVLLAMGRLAADLELVAMRAGGVSLSRLQAPLLGVGLALSLGMAAFNEYALPQANLAYKQLFYQIVSNKSDVAIQEKSFVRDFEGMIVYVNGRVKGARGKQADRLEQISIVKPRTETEPTQWIQARWGRVVSDAARLNVYLELNDGTVQFSPLGKPSQLTELGFVRSRVDLDIGGALQQSQTDAKKPQEMSLRELTPLLAKMPDSDGRKRGYAVELHRKWSLPFACLAFVLVAFPLGSLTRKGGRMLGFVMALAVIFVYYLLLSLGETFSLDGRMHPMAGIWMPNLALFALAAALSWAVTREKGLFKFSRG